MKWQNSIKKFSFFILLLVSIQFLPSGSLADQVSNETGSGFVPDPVGTNQGSLNTSVTKSDFSVNSTATATENILLQKSVMLGNTLCKIPFILVRSTVRICGLSRARKIIFQGMDLLRIQ